MPDRKMVEIEDNFVSLENPGDAVEGTLVARDSVFFAANNTTVGRYRLRGDDGVESVILGSTALDGKLSLIPTGKYVRVEFRGKIKTSSGKQMKDYKVEFAD